MELLVFINVFCLFRFRNIFSVLYLFFAKDISICIVFCVSFSLFGFNTNPKLSFNQLMSKYQSCIHLLDIYDGTEN